MRYLLLAAGIALVAAGSTAAQVPGPNADAARRARALLSQMTLEEKIGQLYLSAGVGLGGFVTAASDSDIIHGRVGAILWLANPKEMNRMQHLAVEKSRLHIPLLFGLDVIHGYR
ncbi:MAG TPA: glycoside hydrolase family 3 N-terminal domain-containing protein, partial [Gemmatimonadales bacterium]|nr:glycoside hydrolase family 3 N-terminal domain-containing protein [Gemmatimonadales bacterium]